MDAETISRILERNQHYRKVSEVGEFCYKWGKPMAGNMFLPGQIFILPALRSMEFRITLVEEQYQGQPLVQVWVRPTDVNRYELELLIVEAENDLQSYLYYGLPSASLFGIVIPAVILILSWLGQLVAFEESYSWAKWVVPGFLFFATAAIMIPWGLVLYNKLNTLRSELTLLLTEGL